MIRGALILATGFALGYAKALQDSAELRDVLQDLVDELKKPVQTTPDDNDVEEVVEAIEVKETDEETQGETP